MEKRYDTVFWDVDNTLLDFDRSEEYAIEKCFHTYGIAVTEAIKERYSVINQSYWRRLELGEVDKQTLLRGRFLDLFREFGIEGVDVDAFRADYQKWLGSVYYCLEDSGRLLRELKDQGIRQYIVTNGVASTQRNKLKLAGLDTAVDGMFISEEVGAAKPDRAFFDACFAGIPCLRKERALLVGDSLTSDIKGAVNAGIASCLYRPHGTKGTQEDARGGMPGCSGSFPEGQKPTYVIGSLWRVRELIFL